jgi:hypothetical protein
MNSPAYLLASLLLLTTSCRFQSGYLAEQETEIAFSASDPSFVQHIEGLDYQSDDEAGMSHQSLKVVRLIATSNFFRNLPKSASSVTPLLGFESGPEMGTDDPSPVYRFRFYRDPSIQGVWWETLVYDPERAVLYLEYPEDGILEPLEVDQRMLADVRMTMAK